MKIFRTKYSLLNFWLDVAVIIAAFSLVLYIFFWPARIQGDSMAPNLSAGDHFISSRFLANFGRLSAGDLVLANIDGRTVIKRLAAAPGDHLVITRSGIYINGAAAHWQTSGHSNVDIDIVLAAGEYFIIGDDLLRSRDSRHLGPVENRHILAKILLRYFPFDNIKFY